MWAVVVAAVVVVMQGVAAALAQDDESGRLVDWLVGAHPNYTLL